MINQWTAAEAKRAEETWGQKYPEWLVKMYEFSSCVESVDDLGCGFGRYPMWMKEAEYREGWNFAGLSYQGYDSSVDMLERYWTNVDNMEFPAKPQDITEVIPESDSNDHAVICAAVLIHLTIEDQRKILDNFLRAQPSRIAFDINSPSEQWIRNSSRVNISHFEKFIKLSEGIFRMTWQSHYKMTKYLLENFSNYQLKVGFYKLPQPGRHKVTYMLRRDN